MILYSYPFVCWLSWHHIVIRLLYIFAIIVSFYNTCSQTKLLLPRSGRHVFLTMVHEQTTGHFEHEKTLDQVQRRAYWESWRTDVNLYCACCWPCNEFHRGRFPKRARLKPLFAGAPTEVLHVDLTGPHVSSQWYRYILTACDSFTRCAVNAAQALV